MVKSTGNGYTISLCNVLCSFVCFIFTLWIHVWWAVSSNWMPVYSCDHLSPLQADNQSCTAVNVTPLHLWKFFFSPHRISGDQLCCVHLLDGWKKVFRSPEKKKSNTIVILPLLSHIMLRFISHWGSQQSISVSLHLWFWVIWSC